MSALIPITLFGYLPVMLFGCALLSARRAVLLAYLVAWLFLPLKAYHLPGLPEYSKVSAAAVVCVLGTLIFHSGAILRLRPSVLDLPILLYLLSPVLTNVAPGGAGVYEGVAMSMSQALLWGVPWLMGRLFFADIEGARELALGVVVGAAVYVPLCLIEARMSPQLNQWVYGFHQHAFNQTRRMGGWRPMVFMQHGLAVGMWMVAGAVTAIWLFKARVLPRIGGVPPGVMVAVILLTAVLCRSAGAMMLLLAGLGALYLSSWFKTRLVVLALVLAAPVYMVVAIKAEALLTPTVEVAGLVFGPERASSLETRLRNEQLIAGRAMEKPLLGWGGGGRYLLRHSGDPGRILSVPDQFWVITLGQLGLVGLTAMVSVLLLPALCYFVTVPPRDLALPAMAPLTALAVLPVLFMLDCLMNAMMNPLFTIASASVASVTAAAWRVRRMSPTIPAIWVGTRVASGSPMTSGETLAQRSG